MRKTFSNMNTSMNTQRLSRQSEKGIMTQVSASDINKQYHDQISKEMQLQTEIGHLKQYNNHITQ